MALHAYCIRKGGDPGPEAGLTGVDGRPVERLDAGPLQLWLSRDVEGKETVERLRQHERVVRAALRTATPLPLRYGTRFGSDESARAAVVERGDELGAALERLADRVEMSIRVDRVAGPEGAGRSANPPPAAGAPATGPGRGFLERRRQAVEAEAEARSAADRALAELELALADLGLPVVRSPHPRGDHLGSLAHLVHRRGVRLYRQRILELRDARSDLRITLSGPWAPYSFV